MLRLDLSLTNMLSPKEGADDVLLYQDLLFVKPSIRHDQNGLMFIKIGQPNSGDRFYGVMKAQASFARSIVGKSPAYLSSSYYPTYLQHDFNR